MLVLTQIYKDGEKVENYWGTLRQAELDNISFDVKDTDTDNMYRGLKLNKSLPPNILGIMKDINSILCISIDAVTWKILDYIDEVKDYWGSSMYRRFTETHISRYKLYRKKEVNFYSIVKYSCSLGTIYTFKLNYAISQIAKLGIFWMFKESVYITFYHFYQLLNLVKHQDCIAFYVSDRNNFTLKLELNKDINRLLTKFAVMNDKLH